MWIKIREFIGWVLVLVGLALIALLVLLAINRNMIEALALSIPATVVFRAGIGLVRMSAAARIATRLSERETV